MTGYTHVPVLERECDAFMAAEAVILNYLKGTDKPKIVEFAAARKECQRQFREIEARLKAVVVSHRA